MSEETGKFKYILKTTPAHPGYEIFDFERVPKRQEVKKLLAEDKIVDHPVYRKAANPEGLPDSVLRSEDAAVALVAKADEDGMFYLNDPAIVHYILDACKDDQFVKVELQEKYSAALPTKEELAKAAKKEEPQKAAETKKA